jgi:hypothetical protein
MEKIYLSDCEFDIAAPIDENDGLDDSLNGEYGYRVFYNVKKDAPWFSNYFDEIPAQFVGGQMEFTVDEDGEQIGEVLLWTTAETENNGYENVDFIDYFGDISELVDNFNEKMKTDKIYNNCYYNTDSREYW